MKGRNDHEKFKFFIIGILVIVLAVVISGQSVMAGDMMPNLTARKQSRIYRPASFSGSPMALAIL